MVGGGSHTTTTARDALQRVLAGQRNVVQSSNRLETVAGRLDGQPTAATATCPGLCGRGAAAAGGAGAASVEASVGVGVGVGGWRRDDVG